MCVFFAVSGTKEAPYTDQQRRQINRWFWRTSFSKRYSSGVLRNLNTDIEKMRLLRENGRSELGDFPFEFDPSFFTSNLFGLNNVNTKTFILLLASKKPLSFISGQPVDLARTLKEANRTEFHHLMPRSFPKAQKGARLHESILANFAFLSRSDNRDIGGVAPSSYRAKMADDLTSILNSALTSEKLFTDDYEAFILDRTNRLSNAAAELCEVPLTRHLQFLVIAYGGDESLSYSLIPNATEEETASP